MGGGDLNLKKSWHPSTTRNIEKVWKAEQKHDEEQKRINDLRHEITVEKDKEDIQKYAEDKGVIEKKNEQKLEWMYKKPGDLVDREEYLLGRSIDKTFEQLQESEKAGASSSSAVGINIAEKGVDHSSFVSLLAPQVDLARKLQEDPLFAIRKKELETRSQILKNPVKLKKLQQLLSSRNSSKPKKVKKEKKKKKKRKKNSSSEDSDSDIDAVLLDKYKKLKEKLKETDIAVLKNICVDTDKDKKPSSKPKDSRKRKCDSSTDEEEYHQKKDRAQDSGRTEHDRPKTDSRNHQKPIYTDRYKADRNWKKPERKKLTEEEIERRRAEMLDNAKWREQERDKSIARNKAEEEYEKKQMKDFDKDFARKQFSIAASQETVEGRIRSNINNIQRSGMAMDKNFARR